MRAFVVGAVMLGLLGSPSVARACGAAYPGGPVMCDYPRAEQWKNGDTAPAAPIARLSTSYEYTSTTILFGDGRRADLRRNAVFGGVEVPLTKSISGQIGAGGIVSGELDHGAAHDDMGPGFSGSVGIAGRVFDGRGPWPFVQLTAALSVTHVLTRTNGILTDGTPDTRIETPRLTAFDLRVGAIAGKTIADVVTPYVVGRVFGGPAYWHFDNDAVTGTDLHKYQVGGGLSVALFKRRLDLFAEGIALGEQGISAGIGTTFF